MIVIFDNGRSYSDHIYAIVEVPDNFDAEAFVAKTKELFVQFNDYEPQEWWRPIFKSADASWYAGDEGPLPFEELVKTIKERLGAYDKAAWEQEDRDLAPENFMKGRAKCSKCNDTGHRPSSYSSPAGELVRCECAMIDRMR